MNISNNTGKSEFPSITSVESGGSFLLRVVWQDNTPGNYDIFSRLNSNGSWQSTTNITENAGHSKFPIVKKSYFFGANRTVVMWSDNTGNVDPNNYDIWYQLEEITPAKLLSTSTPSMYPSFAERRSQNVTKYLIMWTEGSSLPYQILTDTLTNPWGFAKGTIQSENTYQCELRSNYPNPFNPTTTFNYSLPSDSKVKLTIYSVLGQVVDVLVDAVEEAGYRSVDWNAGSAASGIYFYRLEATSVSDPSKSFTQVKKAMILK